MARNKEIELQNYENKGDVSNQETDYKPQKKVQK